jgi:hypothetical protein
MNQLTGSGDLEVIEVSISRTHSTENIVQGGLDRVALLPALFTVH